MIICPGLDLTDRDFDLRFCLGSIFLQKCLEGHCRGCVASKGREYLFVQERRSPAGVGKLEFGYDSSMYFQSPDVYWPWKTVPGDSPEVGNVVDVL